MSANFCRVFPLKVVFQLFQIVVICAVCSGQCTRSRPLNEHLNVSEKSTNNDISSRSSLFSQDLNDSESYMKSVNLQIIPGYSDDEDFENWIPPQQLRRDMPIYMSGFDYNNQPIWVLEWGRWKFGKYAHGSKKQQALFDKYMRYLTYVALKSQGLRSTKEHRIDHHVVIYDLEGVPLDILLDRKAIQCQRKVASDYRRYYEKHVSKIVVINVNPVGEILLNFARPFFLRLLERLEVYGTNKSVWAPQLLKSFPKDQLPEWYGGNAGFQPLCVIG